MWIFSWLFGNKRADKDAAAAGAEAVGTNGRNDHAAARKDASIYAKKAVKEEDASICASKSA